MSPTPGTAEPEEVLETEPEEVFEETSAEVVPTNEVPESPTEEQILIAPAENEDPVEALEVSEPERQPTAPVEDNLPTPNPTVEEVSEPQPEQEIPPVTTEGAVIPTQ